MADFRRSGQSQSAVPGWRAARWFLLALVLRKLNIEYESKRDSERLAPLQAAWLRDGTGDAYKAHCVAEGQREGQFKCVALTYRKSFGFDLEAHAAR